MLGRQQLEMMDRGRCKQRDFLLGMGMELGQVGLVLVLA